MNFNQISAILCFFLLTSVFSAVLPAKDCSTVICAKDQTCQNGSCKKLNIQIGQKVTGNQVVMCPKINNNAPIYCERQDSSWQNCPNIQYRFVSPDPEICGVDQKGGKFNYGTSCEACKNPNILYYFQKPCYQTNFICENGQKCGNYFCQGRKCTKNSQCLYDWQSCQSGVCVDSCVNLKCPNCKYGTCQYEKPNGLCIFDWDCKSNWSCIGYECVDMCLTTPCALGFKCDKGFCVPQ